MDIREMLKKACSDAFIKKETSKIINNNLKIKRNEFKLRRDKRADTKA